MSNMRARRAGELQGIGGIGGVGGAEGTEAGAGEGVLSIYMSFQRILLPIINLPVKSKSLLLRSGLSETFKTFPTFSNIFLLLYYCYNKFVFS